MGTSSSSSGPSARTPLVPSWLVDEPQAAEASTSPAALTNVPPNGNHDAEFEPSQPLPPIPPTPSPGRFTTPRRNFSTFARSGGNDGRALRRAVGDYVRSGTGGSGNATLRMGASRTTAQGALGILRDFQRDGIDSTLRRLNLGALVGRPLEDVFIAITDVICGDGGSVDEGIAREAWLETVAELDGLAVVDPSMLPPEQAQTIFLTFISNSVIGRLLQDIGARGFKFAVDLAGIVAFEAQLKSYIQNSVRDSFSDDLTNAATLTDQRINVIVDRTYQEAWEILRAQGESEA